MNFRIVTFGSDAGLWRPVQGVTDAAAVMIGRMTTNPNDGFRLMFEHDPHNWCEIGIWEPGVVKSLDFIYDCAIREVFVNHITVDETGRIVANAAEHDVYTFRKYDAEAGRTRRADQPQAEKLLNGALGVGGESGEILEHVKKVRFHGKPFDPKHIIKEIGDVLWYCALLADACGTDLETVARTNIIKLKARYPHGFNHADSERRVDVEQGVMSLDDAKAWAGQGVIFPVAELVKFDGEPVAESVDRPCPACNALNRRDFAACHKCAYNFDADDKRFDGFNQYMEATAVSARAAACVSLHQAAERESTAKRDAMYLASDNMRCDNCAQMNCEPYGNCFNVAVGNAVINLRKRDYPTVDCPRCKVAVRADRSACQQCRLRLEVVRTETGDGFRRDTYIDETTVNEWTLQTELNPTPSNQAHTFRGEPYDGEPVVVKSVVVLGGSEQVVAVVNADIGRADALNSALKAEREFLSSDKSIQSSTQRAEQARFNPRAG